VERSAVRRILGATPSSDTAEAPSGETPAAESIRELAAYVDPFLGVRPPERKPPSTRLPRLYDEDYAILALLDRAGFALPGMLRRASRPVSPSARCAAGSTTSCTSMV